MHCHKYSVFQPYISKENAILSSQPFCGSSIYNPYSLILGWFSELYHGGKSENTPVFCNDVSMCAAGKATGLFFFFFAVIHH